MKTQIIFNLDLEIVDKLRELDNRSAFVNELLQKHFEEINPKRKENIQEKEQELKDKIQLLEQEKQVITKKQEQEQRIAKINLPPKIKEWFLKVQEKPNILQINEFLKNYKIPKMPGDLEMYSKAYDELKNGE